MNTLSLTQESVNRGTTVLALSNLINTGLLAGGQNRRPIVVSTGSSQDTVETAVFVSLVVTGPKAGVKESASRRSKTPLGMRLTGFQFALLIVFALLSLAGCSSGPTPSSSTDTSSSPTPAARQITSAGVVKTLSQSFDVVAGSTTEVVVRLTIEKGFHLNANPPTYPYLIPTALEIKPGDGLKLGKVTYPAAITQQFGFAEKPLAVYEGEKEIKAEVVTEKTAAKGIRTLPAVLRIQACDDQVCYPPGTIHLQIPLTVK